MAKDSKNWESPLEKTLKQQQELARRIMDGRLLDDFKDLQEKINKPYKDIQTTIRKINQPYKDLQVGLTKSLGNVAMGQLGLAALSHTQNLTINTAMGNISKQNSLQALAGSVKVPNIALTQLERSFTANLSSRFSTGSVSQKIAESLERSAIESRRSIDGVMNRSFTDSLFSGISPVIGLQSLAGQQALNTLNAAGLIGSATASIALENRYFTDLLPRFSTESAFREATELSIYRLSLLIEVISKLANLGWFLARKILQDIPTDLLETLRSTDPTHIANIMSRYFRKKLDIIANEIIINYPERQDLLDKIFQTHKQGEYNISIPLSLIQADGISNHRFGGEVFMKRGRRIIASHSLSSHAEDLISNESLPIWASESNRPNKSFILNRHQIVHGESTDYGNELNSLKAISFLYWIHCLA